jgi:hypothetical protein
VLAEANEILMLLESTDATLSHWLRAKIKAASVGRKPLFYPRSANTLCVTAGAPARIVIRTTQDRAADARWHGEHRDHLGRDLGDDFRPARPRAPVQATELRTGSMTG